MNHLKMHSLNKIDENVSKIAQLFPNCVTEAKDENGEITHKIDFDMLKQELSTLIVEGREERYQFTWPDKKQAILTANAPINKTLRPCREESVNFDTTENLYIEGDNLEVLKLLQETYLGKIKMIYIDPPYNTGNDFVYEDDFAQDASDYIANSGQTDEEGNRLVANTESNGRFHTDWLNMMYPRLKLARDLLTDDGVIFISIDDNEVDNLKKICDEVYGGSNFIAQIAWKRKKEISNDSKNVAIQGEYILLYSKSQISTLSLEPLSKEYLEKSYNEPTKDFPLGKWRPVPLTVSKGLTGGGYTYSIITPSGKEHTRLWAYPEKSYNKLLEKKLIYFGIDGTAVPQRVMYAKDSKGQPTSNYWDNVGSNKEGKKEILDIFGDNFFDTPKPTSLIKKMLMLITNKDTLILDFFSGSATTAHAVMQLNAEDGGNRKFIMVQLPEVTDEKSEAYKAGYKNICEIGKERIRRAAKKIKEENPESKFDGGFRVLKVDSSNMQDVYYSPEDLHKQDLFKDNVKQDRSAEDLLFQVMLDLGIMLSSKIETKQIDGKTVFYVEGNYLVVCFEQNITEEIITQIAKEKPYYFIMKDSGFANDSVATNFEQIFTTYSADTVRKVL